MASYQRPSIAAFIHVAPSVVSESFSQIDFSEPFIQTQRPANAPPSAPLEGGLLPCRNRNDSIQGKSCRFEINSSRRFFAGRKFSVRHPLQLATPSASTPSCALASPEPEENESTAELNLDFSALRKRMDEVRKKDREGPSIRMQFTAPQIPDTLPPSKDTYSDPLLPLSVVYVLLVNTGTEREAIYSLKSGDADMVLSFESEGAALQYSSQLDSLDFPATTVKAFDPEKLRNFCLLGGYRLGVVAAGSVITPPELSLIGRDGQPITRNLEEIDATLPTPPVPSAPAEPDTLETDELAEARARLNKLFGGSQGSGPASP